MSSIHNFFLNSLLGNLSFTWLPHIHLTILISARWCATSFSFLTGQVSLWCDMLFRTWLLYNLPLSQWYMCIDKQWYQLPEFIPAIWILASTAASASPSTVSMSPRQQNLSTNSNFALAPISTLVRPALVTGFKQPLQINDFITLDFTVYTTALLVYPFLTTSTLYWIATNTFTADPTWPSYSLLPHLQAFSTYHNLGFIHI